MALRDAIAKLQAYALLSGAKEAPTDPTEGAVEFPFSVCYPSTGTVNGEAGKGRKDITTLFLDFHVARNNLPVDMQVVLTFFEKFPDYLIDDCRLGGAVDTIVFDNPGLTFQFGEMKYADLKSVGIRFSIPVKMKRSISV